MTDLISSLADSIIALINSKPSSPSKEEVEKTIRHALPFHVREAMGQQAPWVRKFRAAEDIKAGDLVVSDCQGEAAQPATVQMPYKDPSPELMQLLDAVRSRPPCPVYKSDHEYEAYGADATGWLCPPNDPRDVTDGSVLRCSCGTRKP